jgi:hypothetical protein
MTASTNARSAAALPAEALPPNTPTIRVTNPTTNMPTIAAARLFEHHVPMATNTTPTRVSPL